jgi:hypothetical protein
LNENADVYQDANTKGNVAMRGLEASWMNAATLFFYERKGWIERDGSANSHTRFALSICRQPKSDLGFPSGMSDPRTSPSDPELTSALAALRGENPSLGIPKLHALLLSKNPGWLVSEKRTRKVLQSLGLTNTAKHSSSNSAGELKSPFSKLFDGLDPLKYTQKVRVEYFDQKKGKGLIATTDISEGTVIWKEDPFALAPEW